MQILVLLLLNHRNIEYLDHIHVSMFSKMTMFMTNCMMVLFCSTDVSVNESVPTVGGLHTVTHHVTHRPVPGATSGTR